MATDVVLTQKKQFLDTLAPRLMEAVPENVNKSQLIRVFHNALTRTPKLKLCTNLSLANALMTAAELGLQINTSLGQGFIIPYKDQATFQLGYRGLKDLVFRTGQVEFVDAKTVYANDKLEISQGSNPNLLHIPNIKGERGEAIGYYAVLRLKNTGTSTFEYMSKEDVMSHGKKYSRSYEKPDSPWQTAFDSMALKTVLLKLLKLAPISGDNHLMQRALESDQDSVFFDAQAEVISSEEVLEVEKEAGLPRAPGRPAGSKNRPKEVASEESPWPGPTVPPAIPDKGPPAPDTDLPWEVDPRDNVETAAETKERIEDIPPPDGPAAHPSASIEAFKAELLSIAPNNKLIRYIEGRGIDWREVGGMFADLMNITEIEIKDVHGKLYDKYGTK